MKRGSIVKQIVKPIEGTIISFQIDQETGAKLIEVQWIDDDGQPSSRFFREAEVEVVSELIAP